MELYRNRLFYGLILLVAASLLVSSGCRRKKYENPITKSTEQPDKVLFDAAIKDLEKGRYEVARLTLNTLMNTYDQSEYLAKAKLALADSWYREGGSSGMANAKAEYKDFILFYPMMEEAAEAQYKVCMIEYRQMEKPDRDATHAIGAEEECRQVLTQFPNSKYALEAQQRLREIQEVLAEGEFRVGTFYQTKGVHYSAVNRFQGLTSHFPLYSKADEALWKMGDSLGRMGPQFRGRSAEAYTRLVREYPLSPWAEVAKKKLNQMEMPVPEPDPVALARQKYELENQDKAGMMSHFWGIFRKSPDVRPAAKSGTPAMEALRPTVPVTVPGSTGTAPSAEVTATPIEGPSALDTKPDARTRPPAESQAQQPEPKNQKKKK